MSLRLSLLALAFVAVVAGTGFGIVIQNVDPEAGGALGLTLFFVTLFFLLAALTTLVGFAVRALLLRHVARFRHLGVALRQGILLAALATLALLLLGEGYLRWWNAFALVLFVASVEFTFLATTPPPHRR